MELRITFDELGRLLTDYVQVGYAEAVRAYEPTRDLVRRSELLSWLKFIHADIDEFRRLEKRGDIRARRKGKADNSPLFYSKSEVKRAMALLRVYRTANKDAGWNPQRRGEK